VALDANLSSFEIGAALAEVTGAAKLIAARSPAMAERVFRMPQK
jgi:hypothetical protein